jgi:transposase
MRGRHRPQRHLISLINVEERIPQRHPIRQVKAMTDAVLAQMDEEFTSMYASSGRASIPPERLLKAKLLEALYTVRSDRQFCERLCYDLLFQWFLDMEPDEPAFDPSTFSKNMDRLLTHHVSEVFFMHVVELAQSRGWVSNEHFSVDGTLIESWASLKSFRSKDEPHDPDQSGSSGSNGWVDFKGQKRSNKTHESTTDPESRLMRKGAGKEARLSFGAHAVTENRNGLLMLLDVRPACGAGCHEPEVASDQLDELTMRGFEVRTVGGDRNYHTAKFVRECRDRKIAPHVALRKDRKTPGLDGRHARSRAYRTSQRLRKRVEEPFGWMKTTGCFRRSRWLGVERTHFMAQLVGSACNLVRMAKLSMDEAVANAPPEVVAA